MAVIGITPSNRLTDYLESIRRAGGEPRVLSHGRRRRRSTASTASSLPAAATSIPRTMATRVIRHTNEPDAARDAFELALAKLALAKDTPLLAVCRGLQVVNVAAGGTLIQDIPSQVNQALGHQVDSPPFAIAHEVWVDAGHDARARDAGRAGRRRGAAGEQPSPSGGREDRRRVHHLGHRARRRRRGHRASRGALLRRACSGTRKISGARASSDRCSRNS